MWPARPSPVTRRLIVAARGLLAILFGLAIVVRPELSLNLLMATFGVYAMLDGAWAVASALWVVRDVAHSLRRARQSGGGVAGARMTPRAPGRGSRDRSLGLLTGFWS